MRRRIGDLGNEVDAVIRQGKRFIILSDRDSTGDRAPIPSLLLTAAVHHHLVREKTRTMVGIIVEAGDVREVHHVALLTGTAQPQSIPTWPWRPQRVWPARHAG